MSLSTVRPVSSTFAVLGLTLLLASCGANTPAPNAASTPAAAEVALSPSPDGQPGQLSSQALPPPPSPGDYSFRSTATAVFSGKCMDVPGGSKNTGVQLIQWTCNKGDNQSFDFLTQNSPGKNYPNPNLAKISIPFSGKCLIALGGGSKNGTPLVQGDCASAETWDSTAPDLSRKEFQLRSQRTGRCLDVEGASKNNGAMLILWDCKSDASAASIANQLWRIPGRFAGID
ncbi:RICIN domain-containing protein [Deinococcus sp.]|uniref:RICIN domain-containing protein n=1 Tax=Deinococcus sp. TaxID=47478 RepID=UPI003B5BEC79